MTRLNEPVAGCNSSTTARKSLMQPLLIAATHHGACRASKEIANPIDQRSCTTVICRRFNWQAGVIELDLIVSASTLRALQSTRDRPGPRVKAIAGMARIAERRQV